jgi:hypothetical protein
MTEADLNKLWNLVPVGEANAARASTIWKRLDMYVRSTVQHQLSWMADAGHICRLSRCMPMGGDVRLYYRMQTNDAAYQCLSLKPLQAPPAHIDGPGSIIAHRPAYADHSAVRSPRTDIGDGRCDVR